MLPLVDPCYQHICRLCGDLIVYGEKYVWYNIRPNKDGDYSGWIDAHTECAEKHRNHLQESTSQFGTEENQ